MFSDQDILELIHAFPPESQHNLLVPTASSHGLVTNHSLHNAFESLVTASEPERHSLSDVSSKLDVKVNVVLQLVHEHPQLALLSQNGQAIAGKPVRDLVFAELEELLTKQLVSKNAIAQKHDVSLQAINKLVHIPLIKQQLEKEMDDDLLGARYATALSNTICEKLQDGLNSSSTVNLSAKSLPGSPPIWLIQHCLPESIHGIDTSSQFYLENKADAVWCTPKQAIVHQRDAIIAQLESGTKFCIDRRDFSQEFKDLYASSGAVDTYLASLPFLNIIGDFAVSIARLANINEEAGNKLFSQGYVDLVRVLPADTPPFLLDRTLEALADKVVHTHSKTDPGVRAIEKFVITTAKYDSARVTLFSAARTQAKDQWEALKPSPELDPKLQQSTLLPLDDPDAALLDAIATQKDTERDMAAAFCAQIAELEEANEAEFAALWTDKVVLRIRNYADGLASVDEDAKLRDQLADLLANHVRTELLPDQIGKARGQSLLRSRRTRKNVSRFEAALKSCKPDLTSVLSSLDKFAKKQGVPEVSVEQVEGAKDALMLEMWRRMEKPKTDAPLLFLLLVLLLLAREGPGAVYATGKFAPKLMKVVKGRVESEVGEKLERWKESAKKGVLMAEERREMVRLAEAGKE